MAERSVEFFDDRDDADLLAHARLGDQHCADVLWIRLRPGALAVARSLTGNKHDAEDLASEAMTKVFAAIGDGRGPESSVFAYLCTTMRNLHLSTLRREARTGTPLELDEERVLSLVTDEPDVVESEIVAQAFKNLPVRWRHVLWANLVEGRDGADIARELGVRPTAVHALKSRALEGLRQGYLTEHAKMGEDQDCVDVHRQLAALARGRTRRSTDVTEVWRHLRECEHCAEGYREITSMNTRIGALLGPAAGVGLLGVLPGAGAGAGGFAAVLKLPAHAGQFVAAAAVAGAVAIGATTLTPSDPAPTTTQETRTVPNAVAPITAPVAAAASGELEQKPPAGKRRTGRAAQAPAAGPACDTHAHVDQALDSATTQLPGPLSLVSGLVTGSLSTTAAVTPASLCDALGPASDAVGEDGAGSAGVPDLVSGTTALPPLPRPATLLPALPTLPTELPLPALPAPALDDLVDPSALGLDAR